LIIPKHDGSFSQMVSLKLPKHVNNRNGQFFCQNRFPQKSLRAQSFMLPVEPNRLRFV